MILGVGHVTFCLCGQTFRELVRFFGATSTVVVLPPQLQVLTQNIDSSQQLALLGESGHIELTSFISTRKECTTCAELKQSIETLVAAGSFPSIDVGDKGLSTLRRLVGHRGEDYLSGLRIRSLKLGKFLEVHHTGEKTDQDSFLDQHGLVSVALYCTFSFLQEAAREWDISPSTVTVFERTFSVLFIGIGGLWIELVSKVD